MDRTRLEEKVSELTIVYSSMLKELANLHDLKESSQKELQLCEQNFKSVHILTDCVFGKLEDSKKALVASYNNEDYIPIRSFTFDRSMVAKPEEKNRE